MQTLTELFNLTSLLVDSRQELNRDNDRMKQYDLLLAYSRSGYLHPHTLPLVENQYFKQEMINGSDLDRCILNCVVKDLSPDIVFAASMETVINIKPGKSLNKYIVSGHRSTLRTYINLPWDGVPDYLDNSVPFLIRWAHQNQLSLTQNPTLQDMGTTLYANAVTESNTLQLAQYISNDDLDSILQLNIQCDVILPSLQRVNTPAVYTAVNSKCQIQFSDIMKSKSSTLVLFYIEAKLNNGIVPDNVDVINPIQDTDIYKIFNYKTSLQGQANNLFKLAIESESMDIVMAIYSYFGKYIKADMSIYKSLFEHYNSSVYAFVSNKLGQPEGDERMGVFQTCDIPLINRLYPDRSLESLSTQFESGIQIAKLMTSKCTYTTSPYLVDLIFTDKFYSPNAHAELINIAVGNNDAKLLRRLLTYNLVDVFPKLNLIKLLIKCLPIVDMYCVPKYDVLDLIFTNLIHDLVLSDNDTDKVIINAIRIYNESYDLVIRLLKHLDIHNWDSILTSAHSVASYWGVALIMGIRSNLV